MAKESIQLETVKEILKPITVHKNAMKEHFYQKWNKEWHDYPLARQTKQFFQEIDSLKSKDLYKETRIKVGKLIRVISGHNTLNYHMSLMAPGHDHRCRFCEAANETFYHYLTECPGFETLRAEIFYKFALHKEEVPELKVQDILNFAEDTRICHALEFYQDADVVTNVIPHNSEEENSDGSQDLSAEDLG